MDPDLILDEQMSKLEGIPLDVFDNNAASNIGPVETAETLRGEVPFGATQTPVQTPVQNNFIGGQTTVNPVQNVIQEQMNNQAAAQVVQPTNSVPQTAQQISVAPQPRPVQAAPVVDLDAAPVFVSVNQQTTTQTEYLKLKEGEMTRVALVSYNASQTHFHYEQGLGYFKCLSDYDIGSDWPTLKEICCLQPNPNDKSKVVGKGKKKIFLPVIEYPVSHADGKGVVPGATPKLKIIALSGKEWGAIAEYQDAYPDAKTIDLFIKRRRDESNYLTYATTPMPTVRANYNGAVEAEIAKITNRTYNLAAEEFAKTLTSDAVRNFYDNKRQSELMANQLANQPVPTSDMLGI